MKICIVSYDFLPSQGGIPIHVYELSKTLVSKGHKVWVVTTRHFPKQAVDEVIDGINVHRIRYLNIWKMRRIQIALYAGLYIRRLIKRHKINIVHWHVLGTDSFATKLSGKSVKIFTNHSSQFLLRAKDPKKRRLLRFEMSHADKIITTSEEIKKETENIGINPGRIINIPNGVDVKRFNNNINGTAVRKKYNILKEDILILCPRNLVIKTGIIYLIKAAPIILKQYKNTKFLIVGDGIERNNLENEVKKNRLEDIVIFTGTIPNSKMPEYYAASDIVVLPSLIEATSISGLEALACGKALIGTNVGGIIEIIDDKITGILIPPKDVNALADSILSLVKDYDLRTKLGLYARERTCQKFSWEKIAEKTMNVYKQFLNSK